MVDKNISNLLKSNNYYFLKDFLKDNRGSNKYVENKYPIVFYCFINQLYLI